MLLQVITGDRSVRHFHPVAVRPDNVIATCWVDPRVVFIKPDADDHVTAVTLKEPIVISVDDDSKPIFSKELLVTGHFQEISVDLGLDTTGQIAEDMKWNDT